MAGIEQQGLVVASSNLNVSLADAALFGPDDYRRFLQQGDFDRQGGMDWTPLTFPAAARASGKLATGGEIAVLHESPREMQGFDIARLALRDPWAAYRELRESLGKPLLDDSYEPLKEVEIAATRTLPLVMYPFGQQIAGRTPRRPREAIAWGLFSELWYRPDGAMLERVGASSDLPPDERVSKLHAPGRRLQLGGAVVNPAYMVESQDDQISSRAIELVAAMARRGLVKEVELSFTDRDTQHLAQAIAGHLESTPHGEMLEAVRDNWPKEAGPIRVVSRIRASLMRGVSGAKDYAAPYKELNGSIRSLMTSGSKV